MATCTGSFDAIECGPGTNLFTIGFGAGCLCVPDCHPLLQDCAVPGETCNIWNYPDLVCGPDFSGEEGQANDPCEDGFECDPGLTCIDTKVFGKGCAADVWGCCTPFCEFPNGVCPNSDQHCEQYRDPDELLPGDWRLGIGVCTAG